MTTTSTEHPPAAATAAAWQTHAARLITEIFAPWVLIIATFLAVGWHAGHGPGLAWGLFGAMWASIGPMLAIVTGVLIGRFTDHHLTVREHRLPILILSVALVVSGIVVLALLGAPRDVVAVEAAMLGGLLISGPITAVWKISFHTGVAAASVAMVTIVYGPWLALSIPVLALIGWSRVRLTHHTIAQVLAGAPVGALAAVVPFLLVR